MKKLEATVSAATVVSKIRSYFLGRTTQSKIVLGSLVLITLGTIYMMMNQKQQNIRIHFPVGSLERSLSLLDPNNTETIWEYYLLENLSCGLIRDSMHSSTGYEGCLSDRYWQEGPKTWVFHLRENLKWSNGDAVSSEEITNWINQLRFTKKRHIKYLRSIENFKFDEQSRNLRIDFSAAVDSTVLHELSLADAGLFPVDYKSNGWRKTVGPYSVSRWVEPYSSLELVANPQSPLFDLEMPRTATLFFVHDPSERGELFRGIPADIVPQSPTSNPITQSSIRANSKAEYVAHPTNIFFFHFNREFIPAIGVNSRLFFNLVLNRFKSKYSAQLKSAYGWEMESQMIPNGFSGRLPVFQFDEEPANTLPKTITINLPEALRSFEIFTMGLEKTFRESNVQLIIEFSKTVRLENHHFAGAYIFVGNQLDPSGSWSFLTSEGGALQPWLDEIESTYGAVFNNPTQTDRKQALENIHRDVLKKGLVIPVFVGSQKYYFSSVIQAQRWNRFDSRLRIYELRFQ